MILITGASGQLGNLVIEELKKTVPANEIVAGVRSPEKAKNLAESGVQIRTLDYSQPETIVSALKGIKRVLLISSSNVGSRATEHKNVIEACQKADLELFAYTSILHADSSPLLLGEEHKQTEAMIRESGLPSVILRNGWYTENYTVGIGGVLQSGAVFGCAKNGKFSFSARADYAAAAAKVIAANEQAGKIYELAGDTGYTLKEYASEIEKQTGKSIAYNDMPLEEYANVLINVGLPEGFAHVLADAEAGASQGALFDDSQTLSRLIERPTTPLADSIRKAMS